MINQGGDDHRNFYDLNKVYTCYYRLEVGAISWPLPVVVNLLEL